MIIRIINVKVNGHKLYLHTSIKLILFFILFFLIVTFFSCKKEEERIMMVRNDSISEISYTTAKAFATIIDPGEGIEQHGHCWSTNTESITIDNENKTENGSTNSTGSYTSILINLLPNTSYYVRAYVCIGATVVSGNKVLSFRTLSLNTPDVITGTVTNITTTGATVSGNLNSLGTGASSVTQHGHCWSSETVTPTINDDNKSSLGLRDSTGNFESQLVGLTANALYYVRAYATNDAGTAYGDAINFATEQSKNIPSVITAAIISVTETSAICESSITSDGGSSITAKGICWDTNLNPTTSDKHTNDGTGLGSFASELTDLTGNTTYYVRAYATNNVGTAYGNHVSFTASDDISIPTVTTTAADDITATTAVSGGNVTFDGGADVTTRGVCWNTTGSPTTSDDRTTGGSGTGIFTSNIAGLTASTLYYVRAYASNSEGTGYGDQVSFTTLEEAVLPSVTTNSISEITTTSAVSGGDVTSDGGETVTAFGVCWSTSENPTLSDINTTDGSGTGSFVSNITGLSPSTTYYVRAYATNSSGTAYGNQNSFTTDYTIGEYCQGGIIFFVDSTGQHGLIASLSDQSLSAEWGCKGTDITSDNGAESQSDGQANTDAIITDCLTLGIAARICVEYSILDNGQVYNDWYLPAINELELLYTQKDIIGGFSEEMYWSSTETVGNPLLAKALNFEDGIEWIWSRDSGIRVRAIRKF